MSEIEVQVWDQKGSRPKVMPALQTHNRQMLKSEGEFARAMIQTGMIAGIVEKKGKGGETMRLLTPAEVVERACTLSALAYAEFRKRGWIVSLPSLAEMRQELADKEEDGRAGFATVNEKLGRIRP